MQPSVPTSQARRLSQILFYCLLFLLSAILVFWKCRYGFANIDESFYLTIPYRLYQGDALFAHEWHLSQMSLMLIFSKVFSFISSFSALANAFFVILESSVAKPNLKLCTRIIEVGRVNISKIKSHNEQRTEYNRSCKELEIVFSKSPK